MKNTLKHAALLVLLLGMLAAPTMRSSAQAPGRMAELEHLLDSMSAFVPGLNDKTELALSHVPLHDYVRTLGKVHRVNVYIEDTPGMLITNNFVDEQVKTIFLFICRQFKYTIQPTGSILNFRPYAEPEKPQPKPKPKHLGVTYADGEVSFDLKNDSLSAVLRALSRLSGETILLRPGQDALVSGFIPATELNRGLENLLFINGFRLQEHRRGYLIVERKDFVGPSGTPKDPNSAAGDYSLDIARDTLGTPYIFLRAENIDRNVIVRDLFGELGEEYFLFDALDGQATFNVDGANINEVLTNLLRGTEFGWTRDKGVYLIGKDKLEGLRQVSIVNLRYRPTEKVIELIPSELKKGVELKEFVELNRIILSGPAEAVREIEEFIVEIDRPVPMVKIEMVVVDVDFSRLLKTGIRAGLLQPGDTLGAIKSLFPGLDYTMDGSTINGILANSGIPALANVGTLRSNFYVQLQAQETRGNLRVVTRPVISTLNGNEANIVIGQTDYYLLQTQTASNGAVNAYNQVSQRYERIEINTTISVKPRVSQDGMVTLEINPNFTSPGTQVSPNIPPSILTRSFQSIIRMRDGETVVLGGLSRESQTSNTEGLPLLSRLPVLKWIFGNNSRGKGRSSLIIYITPTVYYN